MSIQKIEAYKCTYCGKLMYDPYMHEFECRYNPKARTCVTCGFSYELKSSYDDDLKGVRYCPRADKLFRFPCDKYCSEYKIDPHFKE